MGIGAGMFFLQALGGAGKRYTEIKAREKERQFLEQQAETQRTRDMEDWEKKQNILLANEKAKERDDYLQEQRTYESSLRAAGYKNTDVINGIMALEGTTAKDIAIENAKILQGKGLNADEAYNIVPVLTGSPMARPLPNSPILTQISLNSRVFKPDDTTSNKGQSYVITHSALTTQIAKLENENAPITEIEELKRQRIEVANQAKIFNETTKLEGDDTGLKSTFNDKRQTVYTTMKDYLIDVAVTDAEGRIIQVVEGTENLVLDKYFLGVENLKEQASYLFTEDNYFRAQIKAKERAYFDRLATRKPLFDNVKALTAYLAQGVNPSNLKSLTATPNTNDIVYKIKNNASDTNGRSYGFKEFTFINVQPNLETFQQELNTQMTTLQNTGQLKEGSVIGFPSYKMDQNGKIVGFNTGQYDFFFYSGKLIHELPSSRIR